MSKLIKRKDGSYSKRGLWDNIRANKGSGKKPTKEMLKQEAKIKKEENMKSMYKKGGKKMKGESFMEESKEIGFGAPGVKPPKRRFDLGGLMDKDKPKEQPTAPNPGLSRNSKGLPLPTPPSIPDAVSSRQSVVGPGSVMQNAGKGTSVGPIVPKKRGGVIETGMESNGRQNRAEGKANMAGKKKFQDGGKKGLFDKIDATTNALYQSAAAGKANKDFDKAASFKTTSPEALEKLNTRVKAAEINKKYAIKNAQEMKKGGAKSMGPGGGGRFAKMVSGLKKEGKSEDSAKAIAASVGRKKYGKSKFQEMAAAGKKKMMGGKKC
jgi:hypothetical protein